MFFKGKYKVIEVLLSATFESIIYTKVLHLIYPHGNYLSRSFVQY
jgi:hypothetical protein